MSLLPKMKNNRKATHYADRSSRRNSQSNENISRKTQKVKGKTSGNGLIPLPKKSK